MNWLEKLEPHKIGLPRRFDKWRPTQTDIILEILEDEHRFIPINAPTGSGKSLLGIAVALIEGAGSEHRTVYLTGTKALQDQLMRDFRECGLALIKGRNNYWCQDMGGTYTCEEYSKYCKAKECPDHGPSRCKPTDCDSWAGSCPYRQAYQAAIKSKLVITNYSYWVQVNRYARGLGTVDMLICDEAHRIPEELCGLMSTTVTPQDLMVLNMPEPEYDNISQAWKEWAGEVVKHAAQDGWVEDAADRMKNSEYGGKDSVRAKNRLEKVMQKIGVLSQMRGQWVVEPVREGWQFDPVWPFQHTEQWLWKKVERILLESATLTKKTLGLLGIGREHYDWHSYPYVFPQKNAPVYHVKSAAVNFNMKEANRLKWLGMLVQVLKRRTDRKVIVHTISYPRQGEIVNYIADRHPDLYPYCITHDRWSTNDTIRNFKARREPGWLISPSVTTGYDFPYEECECIIWTKLPFPPSQSEVMKMRKKEDDQYAGYLMIQELVQGAGRGMRAADDRCEVIIMDDSWFWVKRRFGHMVPDWFKVKFRETIPPPPPRLALVREMEMESRTVSSDNPDDDDLDIPF